MNILDRLFAKKPRTPSVIEAEIATQHTGIADSRARIEKAKVDRQAAIEAFDDIRHKAADEAVAAATRDIERREHALSLLIPAHAAAVKAEERATLTARADAARKRVADARKLLDRYQALAPELAGIAAELLAIDNEASAINTAIKAARKADPDTAPIQPVQGVSEAHLTEPDAVTPERRTMGEEWEEVDPQTGLYRPATVYNASGEPQNLASRKVTKERVIPGKIKPGRSIISPAYGLKLPSARLGQAPFWPVG